MSSRKRHINLKIPAWVSVIYTLFAIFLVPWTILLAKDLPTHHIDVSWDVSWVGLDIAIMVCLLITGFLASIKSRWIIIFSSITASFILVDSWFDLITSRPGREFDQALVLALFIEIPVALLGYYVAFKALNSNIE